MKQYIYNAKPEKLIHQNHGEIIDCIEGVLQDNYLIATARGYIALLENYVNSNTSNHKLLFSTDPGEIYAIWDKLPREEDPTT